MRAKDWQLLWLIRVCIVLTLCVIVLGAYTRLSDAGLGCPDWPGCYGHLSVPSSETELARANQLYPDLEVVESKAWPEMIHRYFAGSLGLLVFFISFSSIRNQNIDKPTGIALPLSLTAVVIAQALLGMWTVTLKLMPIIVVAHLFGGFTLLSLLVIFHTKVLPTSIATTLPKYIKPLAAFSLIAVIVQIFLGGWTSANYAALMCTSLPICQGEWAQYLDFKQAFTLIQSGHDNYEFGILDYSGRMTIHVSHRIGAIFATTAISLFCWRLYQSGDPFLKNQVRLLLALTLAQISLGISNVLFHLPLLIAVLHNFGGALLLITIVRLNYLIQPQIKHCNTLSTCPIETPIRRTHE